MNLQHSLAMTGHLIGIEPDESIVPAECFATVHRCLFEHANLPANVADAIYCCMVLEHIPEPGAFWDKVYDTLTPGGRFWALTVDARSLFAIASRLAGALRLKDRYATLLGHTGEGDYEMYPTFYRANSPRSVRAFTSRFRERHFLSLHRAGQMNYYVPRRLRLLSRAFDRLIMTLHLPGSVLLMHLRK